MGTSHAEKARAILLSVLMVTSVMVSVVAFTGGAAAIQGNTITNANQFSNAGGEDTHAFNITIEDGDASVGSSLNSILVDYSEDPDFNGSVSGVSAANVTVTAVNRSDGSTTPITVDGVSVTNDGETLTIDNFGTSLTINNTTSLHVSIENVTSPSPDGSYKVLLGVNDADTVVTPYQIGGVSGNTGNVVETTQDAHRERAVVTVNFTDDIGVKESSINLSVTNLDTGDSYTLVENGAVQMGSATSASNFTDGTESDKETVAISVALQEGDYNVSASAEDSAGDATGLSVDTGTTDFTVNMSGKSFEVVPDDPVFANTRNPGTVSPGEIAQVEVYVLDQFDNRLVFNETDSNVTADTSILSSNDGSVNITDLDTGVGNHTNPFLFNVSDDEVETVKLTAFDTGDDYTVTSASAQQKYVARVGGLDVSVNKTELRADGSARVEATVQLTDGSGGDVEKSGIDISISIANRTQAGISLVAGSTSQTTDANGTATIVMTASNANVDVTVDAVETSTGNGYNGNTSFSTVPGEIDAGTSSISADSTSIQVDQTTNVTVTLQDAQNNVIPGETVTFETNNSATLNATSVTTDDNGQATVEVQVPTEVSTTRVNASAGAFNASSGASVNITATPGDATALRINTSTTVIPVDGSREVPVEVVDEFGNINSSAGPYDVTVTSDDETVITVGGSNETTLSSTSGSQNVTVAANSSATGGSATVTANVSGLTEDSVTFTVGTPDAVNLTVEHKRIAVQGAKNDVRKSTTLRAQLEAGGSDIGIENETIEFAVSTGDGAELVNFSATTNADGLATVTIDSTTNTGVTQFVAAAENYTATGDTSVTTTGKASRIRITPETSSAQAGDNVTLTVTFVDSEDRKVPINKDAKVSLDTDLGTFESSGTDAAKVSIAYNTGGETEGTANLTSDSTGEATVTGIGRGVTGQTSVTFGEVTAPNISITDFTLDQTSVALNESGEALVTGNVTLENTGDASGDFTVRLKVDGSEIANSTVTVDASSTARVPVSVLFSETGTFNVSVNDVDPIEVTVSNESDVPPPVVGDNAPTDPDGDGEFEDVNGDGTFNVVDVQALFANLNSDAVQNNVDAFDFNNDGSVDVVDVQALFVET